MATVVAAVHWLSTKQKYIPLSRNRRLQQRRIDGSKRVLTEFTGSEAYLLTLSGRGGRVGSPHSGGVENGGLWWPGEAYEVAVCAGVVVAPCRCCVTRAGEGRLWLATEMRRETKWRSSAVLVEERAA